jgi:2-methylcitrate dehydratase PrpD
MDAAISLAKNVVTIRYEDIPSDVIEIHKKQTLDILATAIGGSAAAGCKDLAELIREWGGKEESTVIGYGDRVPAPHAAQLNATMGDALDYDDTSDTGGVHSATTVIPACFAAAERHGSVSGKEFLAAVAVAVDLVQRMGLATKINPDVGIPPWNGWEITPLYGFFGATAAAGKIFNLGHERMINAFGIAYSQASGNAQCVDEGKLTKRIQPGFAARGGVVAAILAEKGITAANNSFEGRNGLFPVYHQGVYDREALTSELGKRFEGAIVAFKPWPCCRGNHTAIDAALSLRREHSLGPGDISQVTVTSGRVTREAVSRPLEVKRRPRNVVDAQFSIPWTVAAALVYGKVQIKHFTLEALNDPNILKIAEKVAFVFDDSLSINVVEPAIVEIKVIDGRILTKRVDFPYGNPNNPMSWESITEKLRDCALYAIRPIPEDTLGKVVQLVRGMEGLKDVGSVMRLLC